MTSALPDATNQRDQKSIIDKGINAKTTPCVHCANKNYYDHVPIMLRTCNALFEAMREMGQMFG